MRDKFKAGDRVVYTGPHSQLRGRECIFVRSGGKAGRAVVSFSLDEEHDGYFVNEGNIAPLIRLWKH